MHNRHGGLLEFPSLGAQSDSDGSPSANDASAVCKTIRQDAENDFVDAEAIIEAMLRPNMRLVEIKSEEQQSVLLAHRVREQLIKQRTQTIMRPEGTA